MLRIANTLSHGLRNVLSLYKKSTQIKLNQEWITPHPFVRVESERFAYRALRKGESSILTGPPRCGKTSLINHYLQKQKNWYVFQHNQKIVEGCGMDMIKSFAVAYNSHIENLENIYENPEVPKTSKDKWNINKYLLKTRRIDISKSGPDYISNAILNAVINHHNIFKGEQHFTIVFDDFDAIHLIKQSDYTIELLIALSNLQDDGLLKSLFIGKDPFSIYFYLKNKVHHYCMSSISMGFLSKADVMRYLNEKMVPSPIAEQIYNCFGGDIDMISRLIAFKGNQLTEIDVINYWQDILIDDSRILQTFESSLTSEESKALREIYKRLLQAGYMDSNEYIKDFRYINLDKFVENKVISPRFFENISEDINIPDHCSVITFAFPRYKYIDHFK